MQMIVEDSHGKKHCLNVATNDVGYAILGVEPETYLADVKERGGNSRAAAAVFQPIYQTLPVFTFCADSHGTIKTVSSG
jgi:hypothetical protein